MTTDVLTDRELDAWLAEHLFGKPAPCSGIAPDCYSLDGHGGGAHYHTAIAWGSYQWGYSTTGNGMLLVLEAMRERGFSCGMLFVDNGTQHGAAFYRIGARPYPPLEVMEHLHREERLGTAGNAPLPRAVAEAAKAALEASA